MKTFVFALIILCIGTACSKIYPDEEFSRVRENYAYDAIRFDGLWYQNAPSSSRNYYRWFLNKNGIVKYDGTIDSLDALAQFDGTLNEKKGIWGIFYGNETELVFEEWLSVTSHLAVYKSHYKILNDTTIVQYLGYCVESYKNCKVKAPFDTLHFHPFSPKPDSITPFID